MYFLLLFMTTILQAECTKPFECVEEALENLQKAQKEIEELKKVHYNLRKAVVPIGGVIMWWGSKNKIPDNFELCDGSVAKTPDSKLTGKKPNLIDRFVKGAQENNKDIRSNPVIGGHHHHGERRTGGTAITIAQMPKHTHSISARTYIAPGARNVNPQGQENHINARTQTGGTGGNQAHNHTIPPYDNRPEFFEMYFIVRVK